MPLAQRLGIRVVIGETHREETLRAAGIATCQALVSVTDSDIANLETALNARALAAEPRIVVSSTTTIWPRAFRTPSATPSRGRRPTWRRRRSPRPCSITRCCAPSPSAGTCCCWPRSRPRPAPAWRASMCRRASAGTAARHRAAPARQHRCRLVTCGGLPDPAGDSIVVLATRAGLSGMLRDAGDMTATLALPAYNSQPLKMGLPKCASPELRSGQIFHLVLVSQV